MKFLAIKLRKFLESPTAKQLRRFLIIGAISTIISYLTFIIALRLFDINYILANFCAFVAGMLFGYHCNKHWSFGKSEKSTVVALKYLTVYLISLLIGTALLKIAVDVFGIIPEIAFILNLCFTTCFNFLGIKFFVFKE